MQLRRTPEALVGSPKTAHPPKIDAGTTKAQFQTPGRQNEVIIIISSPDDSEQDEASADDASSASPLEQRQAAIPQTVTQTPARFARIRKTMIGEAFEEFDARVFDGRLRNLVTECSWSAVSARSCFHFE